MLQSISFLRAIVFLLQTENIFLSQICLILNIFIQYFLLTVCGDIETNPGPSNDAKSLSICHWNLNGISTQNYVKLSMIEAYNALYNYDIICISKTFKFFSIGKWFYIETQRFELIRSDHPSNTKRGGVCLYYKEHLPLKLRINISTLNECITIELKTKKHKCFITCLINDEFAVFFDDLETTLFKLNNESPLCSIVLSDFNARNNKWLSTDTNNVPGVEFDKLFSLAEFT